MAERGTEGWVKFFREAGIPAAIAADYAITFNDNRIQRNMLLDLNREVLKEMGITLIGDVIAILRHAKTVHDKRARERILAAQSSSQKSASRGQKDTSETTAKVRKHSSKELGKQPVASASQDEVGIAPPKKRTAPTPTDRTPRKVEEEDTSMEVEDDDDDNMTVATPAPKKARTVLPEHEGGYRITMPAGTTPRSRAVLSMVTARQWKQKHRGTVFDRLGESVVSSTTGAEEITVTGVGNSVFARLGDKPTSTPPANVSGQLQYAGILKKNVRKGTPKKIGTMRADEETGTAKERLGLKNEVRKASTPVEPAVVRKILSTTGKASAGILSNPDNATTRSVKTRLGVTISARIPTKQSTFRQRITGPSNQSGTTFRKIPFATRSTLRTRGGRQWRGGRFASGRGGYWC